MWYCTKTDKYDEIVIRDVDVTTYRFGLATVHAWIRIFNVFSTFRTVWK